MDSLDNARLAEPPTGDCIPLSGRLRGELRQVFAE